MWIRASSQLSDHVYQAVTPASSHFLIFDESAALVDTGFAALADLLIAELDSCLDSRDFLKYIFLTHTHFDHVGGLPALREAFPDIRVIASPAISEAIAKRSLLEELYEKNERAAGVFRRTLSMPRKDWCDAFRVDHILGDGDIFRLGTEADVKLLSLPGHSMDLTGYYVRADGAFTGAEALGDFRGREKTVCCPAWNYDDYVVSIQKILNLDIKVLGLPHSGALSGELARKFVLGALGDVQKFATTVREGLGQGQLIDEIHAAVLAEWVAENLSPEGPLVEQQHETLRAMILAVAETKFSGA